MLATAWADALVGPKRFAELQRRADVRCQPTATTRRKDDGPHNFNFGCGYLHDRRMIEAVQKRCQFAPGELIVVWAESEALGSGRQNYLVIDAAVGIVERGSWAAGDAVAEQPWLPDGPIPTIVTYRKPGSVRARHAQPVAENALVAA